MKKTTVALVILALVLSILGGCGRIPKNLIPKPTESLSEDGNDKFGEDTGNSGDYETPDDDSGSSGVDSLKPAGNPSEGFSNYSTYKTAAYDRITTASEGSDSLAMTVGFGYLGVTMIDLSLISIAMITDDLESSEIAMGMLGMEGVKITGSGNDYKITYTDSEGAQINQTCTYDPGKDQMSSTLYDADGEIAIFFEYVFLGDAYAAQYYFPSNGTYEVIRAYFDKDNAAAFGILTASEKPASILGKSSFNEDFVKNDESYVIFLDGKLTAFEDGEITTN
ncbi:MAG: hypothetical protein GX847_13335 [Clostridiales bacterium]|nr:hypothetical protein [Clostridiales bacterium]